MRNSRFCFLTVVAGALLALAGGLLAPGLATASTPETPAGGAQAAPGVRPAPPDRKWTVATATTRVTAAASALAPTDYAPTCWQNAGSATLQFGTVHGVTAWILRDNWLFQAQSCEVGKASLRMQTDGNLVVYDENGVARWASSWFNAGVFGRGQRADFQGFDNNFVEYDNADPGNFSGPLWSSTTCCRTGGILAVQADGNVVVYDSGLVPLWASGTSH